VPSGDDLRRTGATGKTGKPTETRNKPERPRDRLGRPLPWGSNGDLELEDFDALSLDENHELGRTHARSARWFPAHEAWETAWKQGRGTPDQEFFKGLSQLGAGYVHYRRGNPHGAHTLIRRGTGRIRPYGPAHQDVDVERVVQEAEAHATEIQAREAAGKPLPDVVPPRI
jgi:predicted metal-dependent hydrolase